MSVIDPQILPKIELHVHLDCSLSLNFVRGYFPDITEKEYQAVYGIPPGVCLHSLVEYLGKVDASLQLLQTKDQLHHAALDFCRQLAEDNVLYCEVRFAPLLHTQQGLTGSEVVRSVLRGLEDGSAEYRVEVQTILCTLRHFTEEQSMETVRLCRAFASDNWKVGVVGFDLAGDEANFGLEAHCPAYEWAREHDILCTAHAGEACGPESVRAVLQTLRPDRIGHGVRSVEDESLVQHLAARQIHLEICPSSNLKTGIYATLHQHPLPTLMDHGISYSINTDGRSLSVRSLTEEYRRLSIAFDFNIDHFKRANLSAIEAAFLDQQKRIALRERYLAAFAKVVAST